MSKRANLDIASVNSACVIDVNNNQIENVRISIGGVAAIPTFLKETSNHLRNKNIDNFYKKNYRHYNFQIYLI